MTTLTKQKMKSVTKQSVRVNWSCAVVRFVAVSLFVCVYAVQGMPGRMHMQGAMDSLMGVPINEGGVGSMTMEQIQKVMEYIDYPSRQIGEYHVRVSGGNPLTPLNHGDLRHNPEAVAKVWHDTTGWVKNVSRLHKIQDVAHNAVGKVSVDGWTITENMQKQAKEILRHASKGKGLPKHLPSWVDKQGPNILDKSLKLSPSNTAASAMRTGVRSFSTAAKCVSYITTGAAVAVDGGFTLYRVSKVQDRYYAEQISEEEYILSVSREIGGFAGRTGGLVLSSAFFVAITPAGPVGWVVGVAASPVIILGCGKAGEYVGELIGKGIIAWKKYQFEQDYAAYKDAMTLSLDANVPPALFNQFVEGKAFQAAYKNCWDKRTAKEPNWTDTTVTLELNSVKIPSEAVILRDAFVN